MTLDFAAKRYGVLPSQLLREGDTLDIRVAEVAVAYESFVHENPGVNTTHGLSQQQLAQQMEAVRNAQSN